MRIWNFFYNLTQKAFAFFKEYKLNIPISASLLFFTPQVILWLIDYRILLNLLLYLAFFAPFVLLGDFIYKAYENWQLYLRMKFIDSKKPLLLEIKNFENVRKNVKAMELFFDSIHLKPGETTFISTKFKGATRPWWSFELVSIEGELRFYIWTWSNFKHLIKTQLLAHFPELEVEEVPDYLDNLMWDDAEKIDIWGSDYGFTKKDAYPIKSYIDSGLDKLDPETDAGKAADPLNNVFEKFTSIGEGEVMVLHIMAQVTRNSNWKKEVEEEIEKIYEERAEEYPSLHDPETTVKGMAQLRPHEWELVNALKHSLDKNAFDVGIRVAYMAKKGKIDPKKFGTHVVQLFRSFSGEASNYLLGVKNWFAVYDYPWQDPRQKERKQKKKDFIKVLKYRSYFHPPKIFDSIVLTTEELASIYHFPVFFENIKRRPSSSSTLKNYAPDNLPT